MGSSKIHPPINGDGKDDDATGSGPGHGGDTFPQGERTTGFVVVGLLRFLCTAILAALFYLIIRLHQGRTLTSGQKSIFDALTVAVSLTLGLNSAASLRHIALYARRWFVDKRRLHIKEVSFKDGGRRDDGTEANMHGLERSTQLRRAAWTAGPDPGSHPQVCMCDMVIAESRKATPILT